MRSWVALPVLAALSLARPSRAGAATVLDELKVGSSQPTATNPRSSYVANRLGGVFAPGETVTLTADFTMTRDNAARPDGAPFADRGGNVYLLAAGAAWDATPHLSLALDAFGSPRSLTRTNSSIEMQSQSPIDDQITSRASSAGATVTAGWESARDDGWDTGLTLAASATRYDTVQRITGIAQGGRTLTAADLRAACMTRSAACPLPLLRLLRREDAELTQVGLTATLVQTLWDRTDAAAAASWFGYDQADPTDVGYFSLTTLGRGSVTFGGGVPVAPVLWSVSPDVTHRFGEGAFSARVGATYMRYVADQGWGTAGTLRLQYKISAALRLWLSGSVQREVDASGASARSGFVALGARYKL